MVSEKYNSTGSVGSLEDLDVLKAKFWTFQNFLEDLG